MPFKSAKQRKACFATHGFGGKVDCRAWAKKTPKGFKEWLMENELPPRLYSYTYYGKLIPNGFANVSAGDTSILIDSRKIDVEPDTAHSPRTRKAMEELLKQRPDLANFTLTFDAYSPGTLEQYIKQPHEEFPKYLYHGTSSVVWERAKTEGLQPRKMTGSPPVFGTVGSNAPIHSPDYIYLASDDGNDVRHAARQAKSVLGGKPVILKIEFDKLPPHNLMPDEDSRMSRWEDSLNRHGILAYKGRIKPEIISLHLVLSQDNGWVNPTFEK